MTGVEAMAEGRIPDRVDVHVGQHVRMHRVLKNVSQADLGKALDPPLTFQQIQKYEKGLNRIGASRLQQIAAALEISVQSLFEAAPGSMAKDGALPPHMVAFLGMPEGKRLIEAFRRISDRALRQSIISMIESAAAAGNQSAPPDAR
jgi:transcriptional regulator with XRE-family HTH domain